MKKDNQAPSPERAEKARPVMRRRPITTDYIPNDAVAVPAGVSSPPALHFRGRKRSKSEGDAPKIGSEVHFVTIVMGFPGDVDPQPNTSGMFFLSAQWANQILDSTIKLPDIHDVFPTLSKTAKKVPAGNFTLKIDLSYFDGTTYPRTQTDALIFISANGVPKEIQKVVVVTLFRGNH